MSHISRARSQLSAVVLLMAVGSAVGPEVAVHEPTERSVTRVPVRARADASRPSDKAPASTCRGRPNAFGVSGVDAGWKRRVGRIAGRFSLGMAVGIGGRLAFAHEGATPRVPASNQKLLLSLLVFDRLGPGYRIPTQAVAHKVVDGTVRGNLWVIGRGDPTLAATEPGYWGDVEATTLAELAARIKRSGVTDIRGRVMGASDYFAHDFDAPGWQPYVPGRYVQLPSALVLNGNNIARPPEKAVAVALTKQLERIGIRVSGAPGVGDPSTSWISLAKVRSRPLREIVAYMNRTSNNFFAEVLGKLVGADVYGPPGTIEKGARAIEAWARAHGARVAASDSSGLSYRNRVSPRAIVRMLGVAESKPWGKALWNALPGPGEGTLRFRLQGLDVRAKTGSLFNGASSLSGWVRSVANRRMVEFSIIGQDVPKAIEDRLVRIVSRAHVRVPEGPSPRDCGHSSPAKAGATAGTAPLTFNLAEAGTRIRWRRSMALGTHTEGRLVNGVQLPAGGRHFFTWDPVTKSSPNRAYRRFGTDRLIRMVLGVLRAHFRAHPDAPRVGIGDLSRPNGGDFGRRFGGLGHSSHQNGLDVDVYYPRRDRRERAPRSPGQIDRVLAQDLVDRFVRAGASYVFVGPNTGLTGPPRIVQPLHHHDDHMHVRIPAR